MNSHDASLLLYASCCSMLATLLRLTQYWQGRLPPAHTTHPQTSVNTVEHLGSQKHSQDWPKEWHKTPFCACMHAFTIKAGLCVKALITVRCVYFPQHSVLTYWIGKTCKRTLFLPLHTLLSPPCNPASIQQKNFPFSFISLLLWEQTALNKDWHEVDVCVRHSALTMFTHCKLKDFSVPNMFIQKLHL